MLLAIDPGRDTGWALFLASGPLVACGLGDPRTCTKHKAAEIDQLIIEHPFVYPNGRTRNPNDIVKVAINAGEWAGRYQQWANITYVKPFEWKGQIPKDVHHIRVWNALSEDEKTLANADMRKGSLATGLSKAIVMSKRHNVVDAIGLGLFQLGRLRVR